MSTKGLLSVGRWLDEGGSDPNILTSLLGLFLPFILDECSLF